MSYLRMDLAAISMMPEDSARLGRLAEAAKEKYRGPPSTSRAKSSAPKC